MESLFLSRSTLSMHHYLRESAAPILAQCFVSRTQQVVSVDRHAARLWSFRNQIRTTRWNESRNIVNMKIISMEYLEHIDCVVLFFQRKAEGSFAFQLWHPERLTVLAEATLSFTVIVKYHICSNYSRIVYMDDNSDIFVVLMNIDMKEDTKKRPILFPKENSLTLFDNGKEESIRRCKVFFLVEQCIKYDPNPHGTETSTHHLSKDEVTFVDIPNENCLLIYTLTSAYVYSREREKHRRHRSKRKTIESILNDGEQDAPPPAERNFTDFLRMRVVDMTQWIAPNENGTPNPPDNFMRLPMFSSPNEQENEEVSDIKVFTFTDGSMKFISCDYMSDEDHKRNPKLLYEFVATPDYILWQMKSSPWQSFHGSAYITEFFTSSSDNILTHWGLRFDKPSESYYVDSMGSVRMPVDPQSKHGSNLLRISRVTSVEAVSIVSKEGNLNKKALTCSFGGLVIWIDVLSPLSVRTLVGKKHDKMGIGMKPHTCCYYPPASVAGNAYAVDVGSLSMSIENLEEESVPNGLLALNDNAIEVYSMDSGIGLTRIVMPTEPDGLFVEPMARNQESINISTVDKGIPSSIHWCKDLKSIAIGYTSGAAELVEISDGSLRVLRSRRCHGLAITSIQSAKVNKDKVVIVLGDVSGKLSTFNGLGYMKDELNEMSHVDAHSAGVVSLEVVTTESVGVQFVNDLASKYSLISSSKNTEIRGWTLNKDGTIHLIAYFTGHGDLLSVKTLMFRSTILPDGSISFEENDLENSSSQSLQKPGAGQSLHDMEFSGAIEKPVNKRGDDSTLKSRAEFEKSSVHVSIISLCGFASGSVESLVLSTAKQMTSLDLAYSGVFHDAGVVAMDVVVRERINRPPSYRLLTAAYDGVVCLSHVYQDGTLSKIHIVNTNCYIRSLSCRYFFNGDCIEAFIVTEDSFIKAAISVSQIVVPPPPQQLQRESHTGLIDMNNVSPSKLLEVDTSAAEMDSDMVSPPPSILRKHTAPSPTRHEPESRPKSVMDDEIQRELGISSQGSGLIEDYITDHKLDYNDSSLLRPQTSHDRIHNVEVDNLRKDKRLLDLYRQEDMFNQGYVLASSATIIIDKWLGDVKVSPNNIRELLNIVGIGHEEDEVNLEKLCKVIAVIVVALRQQGIDVGSKRVAITNKRKKSKPYKDLNATKSMINYNSMGERVKVSKSLSDLHAGSVAKINVDGSVGSLRRTWLRQTKRIDNQKTKKKYPTTILKVIPSQFAGLIHRNIEFPEVWSPEDEHWIGLKRAVRIARTLCDMRYASQQEIVNAVKKGIYSPTVASLPSLLVKYFERNFGASSIQIAHQKVMHFVEACLQYADVPILSFMKLCLVGDNQMRIPTGMTGLSDDGCMPQECIWMFIETRNMLISRDQVLPGGHMIDWGSIELDGNSLSTTSLHSLQAGSSVFSGTGVSALEINYLLVRRADISIAIDEVVNKRGKYGPDIIQEVFSVIDSIMSVEGSLHSVQQDTAELTLKTNIVDSKQLVDLEVALETVFILMMKRIHRLRELEAHIFGRQSIPETVNTTSSAANENELDTENVLLTQLRKLRELGLSCMEMDPQRTGSLPFNMFKNVMYDTALTVLNESQEWRLDTVIRESSNRFRDSLDQSISYIDMFCVILSGLQQNGGEVELNTSNISYFVNQVKRGIDNDQAVMVMEYLSSAQTPTRHDCLWTSFPADFDYGAHVVGVQHDILLKDSVGGDGTSLMANSSSPDKKTSSGLSKEGMWNPNYTEASIPSDDPGMLTVKTIREKVPELQNKQKIVSTDPLGTVPTPAYYDREVTNVHGETTRSVPKLPKKFTPKVKIHAFELTDNVVLNPNEVSAVQSIGMPQLHVEPGEPYVAGNTPYVESRHDYNMLKRGIGLATGGKPLQQTPRDQSGSFDAFQEDESSGTRSGVNVRFPFVDQMTNIMPVHEMEQPDDSMMFNDSHSDFFSSSGYLQGSKKERRVLPATTDEKLTNFLRHNRDSLATKSIELTDSQLSLAKFQVQSRLLRAETMAKNFAIAFQEEQERFKRERFEQLAADAARKREERSKEREFVKFKNAEEDKRFERLMAGRLQQEAAAKAAEAEERAKEEAEHQRIEAMRAEQAAIMAAKKAKEEIEKQKQREVDALIAMKAEEKRCWEVELKYREELRVAYEREQQRLREEKARKEKEAREAREAEARRLEAEQKAAEMAEKKRQIEEKKREVTENKAMKQEDYDAPDKLPTPPPTPPPEEKEKDADEVENATEMDGAHVDEETDDETVDDGELTAENRAENRIRHVIKQLESFEEGNAHHPRREVVEMGKEENKKSKIMKKRVGDDGKIEWVVDDNGENLDDKKEEECAVAAADSTKRPTWVDGRFFMPMNFSDDIRFDPFESSYYQTGNRDDEVAWAQSEAEKQKELRKQGIVDPPTNDFSDLQRKVRAYKKTLKKGNMSLFQTSDKEQAPEEWTKVLLINSVDWKEFFKNRRAMIVDEPEPIDDSPSEEELFKMRMDQLSLEKLSMGGDPLEFELFAPSVKSLIPPSNLQIEPLLLGRVISNEVAPDSYDYYQVRLPDTTAMLTIQVDVEFGGADVFCSKGYLPTNDHYDHRRLFSDVPRRTVEHPAKLGKTGWIEEQPGKLLRVVINGEGKSLLGPAEKDGVFIVGVYGRPLEGAKYSVWAVANGQQPPDSEAIKTTSKYILALESIINNDDEQLENYFGLIYKNSHKKAKEAVFDKPKEPWFRVVNRELGGHLLEPDDCIQKGSDLEMMEQKYAPTTDFDGDDDRDIIEAFVLKTGIKAAARDAHENFHRGHNERPDPNMDARFFTDPNIISREVMLDELDPSIYHQSLEESPSVFLSGSVPDPNMPSPQKAKALSVTDGSLNFWMKDWEKSLNISDGKWTKKIDADRKKFLRSLPPLVASSGSSGTTSIQDERDMDASKKGYQFTRREKKLLSKTTVPKYRLGAKLVNGKLMFPWGVNENGLE